MLVDLVYLGEGVLVHVGPPHTFGIFIGMAVLLGVSYSFIFFGRLGEVLAQVELIIIAK